MGKIKSNIFYRRLGGSSRRDNRIPLGGKFSLSARGFFFLRDREHYEEIFNMFDDVIKMYVLWYKCTKKLLIIRV
jgi:hypothetical protein